MNREPLHSITILFIQFHYQVFIYRLIVDGSMEDAIFKRGIDKLRLSWTVLDDLTMKKPFTDQELESLYNVPPANINAPSSPPAMEFPQVCVIRREIEMKCVCIRNAYHFMFPSFEMSFSFT